MNEMILIIEDDSSISNFLNVSLKHMSYKVDIAKSLKEGFRLYTSQVYDLALVDLGLPDGDGLEFIKEVRKNSEIPIIVISARGQERSKVEALDCGADDYITKPFSIGELMARIRVALRHKTLTSIVDNEPIIRIRNIEIDKERHQVTIRGENVKLTPIEFKLFTLLAQYAGKVLVHSFIIKEVWGANYQDTQSLRVFMTSLRRKIEKDPTNPEYIITEVGVGYKLADE